MTSRRILIDARLPWGSGIGRYVQNIVPRVAALMEDTGFTMLVAPEDAAFARGVLGAASNVSISPVTIRPFSIAEQTVFPRLGKQHDLTWFTNYWVPLRWSGDFVTTVHDLIHLDRRFPASFARRMAARLTFSKVRRSAAHIVFVSRFTGRTFEQLVGRPAQATVIHHGIDHNGSAKADGAEDRSRSKVALVVAAAKEHKNLPLLLSAWRRADLTDWRLLIITPGDDLRSSIDLSGQLTANPGIEIRSKVSDAELAAAYADAGMVLVPSRYEGFGLPLLEAMAAGAPVISSTAEALVEVSSGATMPFASADDEDGWVTAIRRLSASCGPSDRWQEDVCARNRSIAQGFTWTKAAEATAGVLAATLRNGRRQ